MPLVMPLTNVEMMFGISVLRLLVASDAPDWLTPASCNQPCSFVGCGGALGRDLVGLRHEAADHEDQDQEAEGGDAEQRHHRTRRAGHAAPLDRGDHRRGDRGHDESGDHRRNDHRGRVQQQDQREPERGDAEQQPRGEPQVA